jgi:acyl-CoA synthetase (AMP-forming)/AMP-acid ligase II
MYTGGTTGQPKGVMLTHASLCINALGTVAALPRDTHDAAAIVAAPMFHVAGCGIALQSLLRLVPVHIVPMFDELAVLQTLQSARITEMFLVPTMIKRVIEHPRFAEFDLSSAAPAVVRRGAHRRRAARPGHARLSWHRVRAGVRHDGAVARGHRAGAALPPAGARPRAPAALGRHAHRDRRGAHRRRRRQRAAAWPGRRDRRARPDGDEGLLEQAAGDRGRACAAAGCTPATAAAWTKTASSTWSTA